MRLRAIVVSTRAAIHSLPADGERLRRASDALLANLESDVLNDGADPDLVRDIELARQEMGGSRRTH